MVDMVARNGTGWCEDLKIDCPHAEKGVLEIIQGCMEVTWQNQGGWNGYAIVIRILVLSGAFKYVYLSYPSHWADSSCVGGWKALVRLLILWYFLGILEAFARHESIIAKRFCLTKAGCVETKLLTKLPAAPTKLRNCDRVSSVAKALVYLDLFGLSKCPRGMTGPCHFATAFIMFHRDASELDILWISRGGLKSAWLGSFGKCWCARLLCQETLLRAGVQDQAPSGGCSKCTVWLT